MHTRLKERLLELCVEYLNSIGDMSSILSELFKNSPALEACEMDIQTFNDVWNCSDDSHIGFIVNYLLYKEASMTKIRDKSYRYLSSNIKNFFDDCIDTDASIICGYSFGIGDVRQRGYSGNPDHMMYRVEYLLDDQDRVFFGNNFDNPPVFSID